MNELEIHSMLPFGLFLRENVRAAQPAPINSGVRSGICVDDCQLAPVNHLLHPQGDHGVAESGQTADRLPNEKCLGKFRFQPTNFLPEDAVIEIRWNTREPAVDHCPERRVFPAQSLPDTAP